MDHAHIVIDIGAAQIKASLFETNGIILYSENVNIQDRITIENNSPGSNADVDSIWQKILSMLKTIAVKAGNTKRVVSISVTGTGSVCVPIDKDGNCLYSCISGMRNHSAKQFDRFVNEFGSGKYFLTTGLQASTSDTVFNIMWLKENEPEVYEKAFKWLMIEDYINYKLCGSTATDYSNANITGLFDIRNKKWSSEILQTTGIRADILPEIKKSGTVLGNILRSVSDLSGLEDDTQVILCGPDSLCAASALQLCDRDVFLCRSGVRETMSFVSENLVLSNSLFKNGFNVSCDADGSKYVYTLNLISTALLKWYISNKYRINSYESIDDEITGLFISEIEKTEPCCSGLQFFPRISEPFFAGAGPATVGAFVGTASKINKQYFSRAFLEGLFYTTKEALLIFEKSFGNIEQVVMFKDINTEISLQIESDIFGKKVCVSDITEAASLGAFMLTVSGIHSCFYKNITNINTFIEKTIYYPNTKNTDNYNKYYDIHQNLRNKMNSEYDLIFLNAN